MAHMKKLYENLHITPVGVEVDGSILTGSVEKACRIDSINVTVETFIDGDSIEKSFNLNLE